MLALSLNMAFIISFFTFVPLFGNKVVANLNDLLSIAWLVCNMVGMKWFRNCNGHSRLARFYQFTTKHTHRDFKHLLTSDCQRTHHQTRPAPTMYPLRKGQNWQKKTSNRTVTGESAHWGACFTGCVSVQAAAEHLDIFLPPPSYYPHTKRKKNDITSVDRKPAYSLIQWLALRFQGSSH